jgi:uncharacterized protein (DUF1778 family)
MNCYEGTILTYNILNSPALIKDTNMHAVTDAPQERINLRLQHSAKRTLERAASFEGKTVSNFILTNALACAEKTIHEHEVMRLNAQDSETFFKALDKPARFNRKLSAALKEYEQRVVSK